MTRVNARSRARRQSVPGVAGREQARLRPHAGRRGLAPDQEQVLELQRLAGNAAVTRAIGPQSAGRVLMGESRIRHEQFPSPPADGIQKIRERRKGAGNLGLTRRYIEEGPPPMLQPEQPSGDGKSWTTRARRIDHVPEPSFEELWPTKGRHELAPTEFLDVDETWEKKLRDGEDQHVADTLLAWQRTWVQIAEIINGLAKKPGPPSATSDAAVADLWQRFRAKLDPDLRPAGSAPTEKAQEDVWGRRQGTLFRWLFDTTVVRDTRGYHTPSVVPKEVGKVTIRKIENGGSEIPGPTSEDLIAQLRAKYTPGAIIKGTEGADERAAKR